MAERDDRKRTMTGDGHRQEMKTETPTPFQKRGGQIAPKVHVEVPIKPPPPPPAPPPPADSSGDAKK